MPIPPSIMLLCRRFAGEPGILRPAFCARARAVFAVTGAALAIALAASPAQAQTQEADNPELQSFGASSGTLSPGFTPRNLRYELSVPGMPAAVAFTPVPVVASAAVTVNGTAITGTMPTVMVPLADAASPTATFTVTSVDRSAMLTYTVRIFRETAPAKPVVTLPAAKAQIFVEWEADRAAHPQITHHDVRYRVQTPQGNWLNAGGVEAADGSEFLYNGNKNWLIIQNTNIVVGTAYEVQLRADNSAGTSAWSDVRSVTLAAAVAVADPTPPSLLNLQVRDSSLITEWVRGPGYYSGYYIRWREARSGTDWQAESGADDGGQFIAGAAATGYTITGLTNEIEYLVQIAAATTAVTSAFGTEARATPTARVSPPAVVEPGSFQGGSVGPGVFSVRWAQPVEDGAGQITGYRIRWRAKATSGSPAGMWNAEDGVLVSSTTNVYRVSIEDSGVHEIQIAAVNSAGTGGWSGFLNVTVQSTVPALSSGLTSLALADAGGNAIALAPPFAGTVHDYQAEAGFEVESIRITRGFSGGIGSIVYLASNEQFTGNPAVIPLNPGINYLTIENRAFGSQDASVYLLQVSRSSLPEKPETPEVRAASATSLMVSWLAPRPGSSPLSGYAVRWRTTSGPGAWRNASGNSNNGQQVAAGTTEYLITSLSEGTSYDVQVRASSAVGSGAWSDSGTATAASNDASLSALEITLQELLVPAAFDTDVLFYRAYFARSARQVKVRASSTHSGASISVDGVSRAQGATATLTLPENGVQNILVSVTAADRRNIRVYQIEANHRPSPPRNLQARIGRANKVSNITVSWQGGETSFGNAAGGIHMKPAGAAWLSDDATANSLPAGVTFDADTALANGTYSATLSGMSPSTAYDVRVADAYTAQGSDPVGGAFSETLRVTSAPPVVTPSALQNFTVAGAKDNPPRVALEWDAPADDGGALTVMYRLRRVIENAAMTGNYPTGSGSVIPPVTTDENSSVDYDFVPILVKPHFNVPGTLTAVFTLQFAAANSAGQNAEWATTIFWFDKQLNRSPIVELAPGAPQNLAVEPVAEGLSLTWTAPAGNAGTLSYAVRWASGRDSTAWINSGGIAGNNIGTATAHTIPNLETGFYTVEVAAANRAGNGIDWASGSELVGSITPPGPPRNLAVTRGANDGELAVNWDAPLDDGNGVLSYALRWREGHGSTIVWLNSGGGDGKDVGGVTRYTISGLADGVYTVEAIAGNSAGRSAFSEPGGGLLGSFDLNVSFSGTVGWVDGILIARYLAGTRGNALFSPGEFAGVTATAAQIGAKIQAGVDSMVLDVDNNGAVTVIDGILIARHLLGVTGAALVAGHAASTAATAIAARIEALRP